MSPSHRIHDAEIEAIRDELAIARKVESDLRATIKYQADVIAELRKQAATEPIRKDRDHG
jgi:hypothetical protein